MQDLHLNNFPGTNVESCHPSLIIPQVQYIAGATINLECAFVYPPGLFRQDVDSEKMQSFRVDAGFKRSIGQSHRIPWSRIGAGFASFQRLDLQYHSALRCGTGILLQYSKHRIIPFLLVL